VPRQIIDDDDEKPRRGRRRAQAVAIEPAEQRGLILRLLLHSPKDMVAGTVAAAAVIAIITNVLFLQAGRHPSPMFGSVVTLPPPAAAPVVASPLPRPRPTEVHPRPVEPPAPEVRPAETKVSDPMTNLVVKSTSAPATTTSHVLRPPASIPSRETTQTAGDRRIVAVQRALTEYGYGQLKLTGTIGPETQAAISKFERHRGLRVTGQVSDRLVRELSAVIGHPID
jgi:hypothetical protein